MKHLGILSILFVTSVLDLSCKHNATEPAPDKPIAIFPNAVGNFWVYSELSQGSTQPETVTVRIVGDTIILGNIPVKIWLTTYDAHIETTFVKGSSDTIELIPKSFVNRNWGWDRYVFPLEVGRIWQGRYLPPYDTCSVVEVDTVSVPAGTFSNAYLIEETCLYPNTYLWVSTWMVPKVGITRQHSVGIDLGFQYDFTWELLRYNVSPY